MKLTPYFIVFGLLFIVAFIYLGEIKKNSSNIQRQKLDLSIDIGKLLFINTVLENKDKTRKQIDSIYEIRKDSILDRLEPTH